MDPTGPAPPILAVALICPYSLSRPGGVQGQVVGLARALEVRGHRVAVFAPLDHPGDAPSGIEVRATGRSTSLPANGSVAPVTLSVPAVVRAVRDLRSGGFDLVHVHEPFSPGVPFGLLVGRGLPPIVATFHRSGPSPFYDALKPLTRRLARRFAVRCAVSPAARATAEDALGGRYEVGFNGVEVERFGGVVPWPTSGPTVLFLGRHEERKGLGVLLSAFDRLRPGAAGALPGGGGPAPTLWVGGDGPQTAALRAAHPDAADLHWLGVLTEEEKMRRLAGADVLCAPSLGGESFGMVLLEAMAARTAVVASDIDGYREAAGGHARLVPPGTPGPWPGNWPTACPGTLPSMRSGGTRGRPGRVRAGRGCGVGRPLVDGAPGRMVRDPVPEGHGPARALSGRTLLGPWKEPDRADPADRAAPRTARAGPTRRVRAEGADPREVGAGRRTATATATGIGIATRPVRRAAAADPARTAAAPEAAATGVAEAAPAAVAAGEEAARRGTGPPPGRARRDPPAPAASVPDPAAGTVRRALRPGPWR